MNKSSTPFVKLESVVVVDAAFQDIKPQPVQPLTLHKTLSILFSVFALIGICLTLTVQKTMYLVLFQPLFYVTIFTQIASIRSTFSHTPHISFTVSSVLGIVFGALYFAVLYRFDKPDTAKDGSVILIVAHIVQLFLSGFHWEARCQKHVLSPDNKPALFRIPVAVLTAHYAVLMLLIVVLPSAPGKYIAAGIVCLLMFATSLLILFEPGTLNKYLLGSHMVLVGIFASMWIALLLLWYSWPKDSFLA